MRTCPRCKGKLIKHGFLKKEKTQRYQCKKCGKCCSDADKRTFGNLRSKPETITLVVQLLCEGMGIRGAARVANCHRDTVLRILKHAGQRSYNLLNRKLENLPVKHVQADELWTYVLKKSKTEIDPEKDFNPFGDYYIFLGLESETKLLLMPTIGKRSEAATERFAAEMARSTTGRFQLTSDGFRPYKQAMKKAMPGRLDFAQLYKEYHMLNALNPKQSKVAHYLVRAGSPQPDRITTSHVERVNASMRHFNKRFARKSISFSKDEEYLSYSVYLFAAYHNFCRIHSALGKKTTPAMASRLADCAWSIKDLLTNAK